MASLVLSGDTSGSITVAAPAVAGSNTQTLAAVTGTLAPIVSGTSQTAPPPTPQYFDFTGIPSWAKRITVMFSGVSTNGTSSIQIQLGTSGGVVTSGYAGGISAIGASSAASATFTSGIGIRNGNAAASINHGHVLLTNVSGNIWAGSASVAHSDAAGVGQGNGSITLSGTLDRVRITTVNGTDTFDAGTINILFE